MFRMIRSIAAALFALSAAVSLAAAAEWTRNDARDEIVRNYGVVWPIIGKDDSLSYAIDLAPDLDDATLLAPFAPIVELILAEENAAAALDQLKGSEVLRALSLDDPTVDTLRKSAQFKNLRTLWLIGSEDDDLTSLEELKAATGLQGLGIEGYTLSKGAAEALAQFEVLTGLTLACDLRGDVLKPLAALTKLADLVIDDAAGEPVELKSLGSLQSLQSLSLQLAPEQPLRAKDFEVIAKLPKLERLDLGASAWKEEDLLKLKSSRSLRLIACDSSLDADAAARLTKEFGLIRFVPYGPALNPIDDLKMPKVTALSLAYDETEKGADPTLRNPAKEYIGDGLVEEEKPIDAADTIAKLRKILSDRETYQNAESQDCYMPERAVRLAAGEVTLEILFCMDCRFVEVHEVKAGDGLIPKPGDPTRYTHSLGDEAGAELSAIVDRALGK
ncbi:MAG TPA: hypothetical protein VGJ26_12785 [Pirellulales bacterium]|jgi:hypothetical protein